MFWCLVLTFKWIRRFSRFIGWLMVLSLPLTAVPTLSGIIAGFHLGYWEHQHVNVGTIKFVDEFRDLVNDWGMGGDAPTFRNFMDTFNDFHLTRINSDDWLYKFGFILPKEYSEPNDPNIPIDRFADLKTLMRDTSCHGRAQKPREQWLYLARLGFPIMGVWDKAYNDVLEYVNAHTELNSSAGFHFAECGATAGFLCEVWRAQPGSLLHFKVEDDPPSPEGIEEGLTYSVPLDHLRPVTVRLIEFPLEKHFTGLPATIFPGPKQQMLSIVAGERLYEQFEPYDEEILLLKRFNKRWGDLSDRPGTVLNYITKIDTWITDHVAIPLGVDSVVSNITNWAFSLSSLIVLLVSSLTRLAHQLTDEFLGRPGIGDRALAGLDVNRDGEPKDPYWEELFGSLGTFGAQENRRTAEQSSLERPDSSMSITRS